MARDYYDESKDKKKKNNKEDAFSPRSLGQQQKGSTVDKTQTGSTTTSQSSSSSNSTNNVIERSSRSTFMGGGSRVSSNPTTSSRSTAPNEQPVQTTESRVKSAADKRASVTQKRYSEPIGPSTSRFIDTETRVSQMLKEKRDPYGILDRPSVQEKLNDPNTFKSQRDKRIARDAKRQADYEEAKTWNPQRFTEEYERKTGRNNLPAWDDASLKEKAQIIQKTTENVGSNTLKRMAAEYEGIVRRSADRRAKVPDPFIENITTPEERASAKQKNLEEIADTKKKIDKANEALAKNRVGKSWLAQRALEAEESFYNYVPGLVLGSGAKAVGIDSRIGLADIYARTAESARGEVKKKTDALKDRLVESGTYSQDEVDEIFKNVDIWDEANAQVQGIIEAGTEMLGEGPGPWKVLSGGSGVFDRVFDKLVKRGVAKSGVRKALGNLDKGILEENIEEQINGPAGAFASNLIYGYKMQNIQEDAIKRSNDEVAGKIQGMLNSPEDLQTYLANVNSAEFLDELRNMYKESGSSEQEAYDLASITKSYYEAAAENDRDLMDKYNNLLVDKLTSGERSLTEAWTMQDSINVAASTTIMVGATSAGGTISTAQAGRAAIEKNGIQSISRAASLVEKYDTRNSVEGEAVKDAIAQGKDISGTQAYEILQKSGDVAAKNLEREEVSRQVAHGKMAVEGLMIDPFYYNEDGSYSIAAPETAKRYNEKVEEATAKIENIRNEDPSLDIDDGTAEVLAEVTAAFETGAITTNEIDTIIDDEDMRRGFEEITGVDLDQFTVRDRNGNVNKAKTNIATQEGLLAIAADNYVESARIEQEAWNDEARGEAGERLSANMEGSGGGALQNVLETVDPRDRSKFMLTGTAAKRTYDYAMKTDDDWATAKKNLQRLFPSLDMSSLEEVFEAGRQDRIEQETPYMNYEVKVGEALQSIANEKAVPKVRGKFVNETPYNALTDEGRDLSGSERLVLTSLTSGFNTNTTMIDAQDPRLAYTDINGNVQYNRASVDLQTGEVLLANNVGMETAVHEFTHVGARLASRQYLDMAHYIVDTAYKHDPNKTQRIFNAYKSTYADQNLSDVKIQEEMVSDIVSAFQNDYRFARDIAQNNPSVFRRILNAIEDVLHSLRNILATGHIKDEAVRNAFLYEIGAYDQTYKMWLEMYRESQKNSAALGIAEWQDSVYRDNRTANARHTNVEQAEKESELFFRDSDGNGLTEREAQIVHDIGPDIRFSRPTWLTELAKGEYYAGLNNGTGGFAGLSEVASGRDILRRTMLKNNFSEKQTNAVIGFLNHMADYFDSDDLHMRYSFIGWKDLTDAEITVRRDKDDNIVGVAVSAMVANGEYPVNFDMTTICNKREGVMEVIQELTRRYDADTGKTILNSIKLTDEKMWSINDALKREGIDTACLGCFVEARRYYTNRFIDKIDEVWNEAVRDARRRLNLPEEEYFNFAKGKKVSGEDYNKISDLWTAYDESAESKRSPAQRIKILMDEIVRNKEVDSPYLKLISAEDILTPEGIDGFKRISTKDRDMVKMIKSIYGTSAPKEILAFTPYNSEIALLPDKIKGKDAGEYLKSIGGTRVQSFSDFKMAHMFDHMQMVADEAARGFVNHGYSKVIAYPRLFGLTGRKINMSVMFDVLPASEWQSVLGCSSEAAAEIAKKYQGLRFVKELPEWYGVEGDSRNDSRPYIETEIEGVHGYLTYLVSDSDYVNGVHTDDVDIDGVFDRLYKQNIEAGMSPEEARRQANADKPFEQSINYREAVALQSQEGYKENVGIIAVAYGDEHMKMLLADPNVRYIIPYHRSGLPVFIAQKTALDIARDYTDSQNTRKAKRGMWYDKDGTKFNLKARYKNFKEEYEQTEHPEGSFPAIEFFKEISQLTFDNPVLTEEEINEKLNEYIQTLPADISEEEKNELIKKRRKKLKKKDTSLAGTGSFDVYKNLDKASDIREISNAYLEHCINKNQVPIFHEFAGDPNYYKVLFDFAVTDGTFNNIYPQRAVRNVYPGLDVDAKAAAGEEITEADFEELYKATEEGLRTENAKNELRQTRLGKVLDEDLLSREGENSIIADSNIQHIVNGTPDYNNPKYASPDVMNSRDVFADTDIITPQQDADYMATAEEYQRLYEANDPGWFKLEHKLQKMVDEAAIENGYNIKAYHGTDAEPFNVFDRNKLRHGRQYGDGFYFSPYEEYADTYGHETREYYLKANGMTLGELFDRPAAQEHRDFDNKEDALKFSREKRKQFEKNGQGIERFRPESRRVNGKYRVTYTTIGSFQNNVILVATEPEYIKSADPITYDDNGNIIPLSERFNQESQDIRYSRNVELDDEYMRAVNGGNMEEAQRLVDEAAKMAGYSTKAYHGTLSDFTVFDESKDRGANYWGKGFYFTSSRNEARDIYANENSLENRSKEASGSGRNIINAYIKLNNPYIVGGDKGVVYHNAKEMKPFIDALNKAMKAMYSPEALAEMDEEGSGVSSTFDWMKDFYPDGFTAEEFRSDIVFELEMFGIDAPMVLNYAIRELGYDGIEAMPDSQMFRNDYDSTHYIVFDPSQIKSADTITYAEDGSVIPLSERFNPNNNDIRYSRPTMDSEGNILSDGQMEYFKNSQAVDEQGRLVPVYHVTRTAGFTVFDPTRAFDETSISFTNDLDFALNYSSEDESLEDWRTAYENRYGMEEVESDLDNEVIGHYKVYLNMTNPLVLEGDYLDEMDIYEWPVYAKANGYDGVIYRDFEEDGSDIYQVFASYQIKDTRNTEPTKNDDIRFSRDIGEDARDYIAQTVENINDIPLRDAALEQNRVQYGISRDAFTDMIQSRWDERKAALESVKEDPRRKELEAELNKVHEAIWYEEVAHDDPLYYSKDYPEMVERERSLKRQIAAIDNRAIASLDVPQAEVSLRKIMKEVRKNSGTKRQYKSETLESVLNDITQMHSYAVNNNADMFAKTAWAAAEKIVNDIDYNDDLYVKYAGIREYFDKTRIAVPESLIYDNDFAEFIRDYEGIIRFYMDGVSFEDAYKHLSKKYKDMFPKDITDPVDQLVQIISVLDYTMPYRDTYSSDTYSALVSEVARNLCSLVENGKDYKTTIEKLKVDAMRQRHTEAKLAAEKKWRDALDRSNARTEAQRQRAERWKQKYQERVQKNKEERRQRSEKAEHKKHFTRIMKNYKTLCDWVLQPTKEKNVPEEFRKSLAEFLQTLDLQTENSKKLEAKTGHVAQKTLKMRELKDRLMNLADKKSADGDYIGSGFEIDAYAAYLMDLLSDNYDGKPIDSLDALAIRDIDIVLKTIIRNIQRYKQVKTETKMAELSEIGGSGVEFFKAKAERDGKYAKREGLPGALATINATALTPTYLFDRMGPLKKMYDVLRYNGFDTYIRNEAMIIDRITEILEPYYNKKMFKKGTKMPGSIIEEWRDERSAQNIELASGKTITMSAAQMMSLYCLAKRGDQALGHMMVGGIVVKPIQITSKLTAEEKEKKGKLEQIGTRAKRGTKNFIEKRTKGVSESTEKYVLTFDDIQNIIAKLTPDQKSVADQLQNLMSVDMAKLGNEAHRELYGYNMFEEDNYFPIKVHGNERSTGINNIGEVVEKIKSFGFTKPLTPRAGQAIDIDDIFSIVADHCNGMNLYNAYLVPITDFMKVFNYTHEFEDGTSLTMKEAITQAYGADMLKYILNLMKDINGIKEGNRGGLEGIMNKALGRAKRTAVFGNVRVALQQPTAIVRAAAEIHPKYIKGAVHIDSLKGFVPTKTTETMEEMWKYCPIAQWKSWGYYDTYMGRDIEDVMMNNWSMSDAALAGYYGQLDNATWSIIWQAVKAEQADAHPDMDHNSEEFLQICGRRASEIFDKTQVVDSTFHRSDAMRSKQVAVKVFTAFMAEPTLTLNVFRAGLFNASEERKAGNKAAANKIIGKTISVIVAQAILVSAAQAFADAWRGKDPGLPWGDDDDDEENAGYWLRWYHNFIYNMFDQMHIENNMYLVKDVTPYINYMFSKGADYADNKLEQGGHEKASNVLDITRAIMGWDQDYLYSQNNLVFAGLENTANGVAQFFKKLEKGDEYVDYTTKEPKKWYDIIQKIMSGIGTFTGLPIGTLMRDFKPLIQKFLPAVYAADTNLMDAIANKMGYRKIGDNTSSGTASNETTKKEKEAKPKTTDEEEEVDVKQSAEEYRESLSDNLTEEQKDEIVKAYERRTKKKAKEGGDTDSEESAVRDKKDMLFDAEKAAAGYKGEERNKKIWESVSKGYKDHIAEGDYGYIYKMRDVVDQMGGDLTYFDQQVIASSKTALKKTIEPGGADTESEMVAQQNIRMFLERNGVTQQEISSELVYSSAAAKDLKVAFRINDEKAIIASTNALLRAGLTMTDYERIFTNRNRIDLKKYNGKYKDRLKSTGNFVWPTQGTITSHFGYRDAPTAGASSNHPAIDIGAPQGTAVVAADGGIVISAGANGGYGNSVGIKHDNGMITWYNHLYDWNVKEGDTVAQGQQIGQVGSTGISTGPHLDFKIMDTNGNPVDPEKYLS